MDKIANYIKKAEDLDEEKIKSEKIKEVKPLLDKWIEKEKMNFKKLTDSFDKICKDLKDVKVYDLNSFESELKTINNFQLYHIYQPALKFRKLIQDVNRHPTAYAKNDQAGISAYIKYIDKEIVKIKKLL